MRIASRLFLCSTESFLQKVQKKLAQCLCMYYLYSITKTQTLTPTIMSTTATQQSTVTERGEFSAIRMALNTQRTTAVHVNYNWQKQQLEATFLVLGRACGEGSCPITSTKAMPVDALPDFVRKHLPKCATPMQNRYYRNGRAYKTRCRIPNKPGAACA